MQLVAENVNKTIRERTVLKDVNLCLESGKVYGFVGRNGSGKTMLFRALSGLIMLSSGKIEYNGRILHKDFEVLPSLGIIIENAGLFPNLTGIQNLEYLAGLKKRSKKINLIQSLQRVGLNPDDKRLYGKYSLGMKQRLAIAQAIMEEPEVLMLDEPTNALDSAGIEMVREIIIEEKNRGALVLIASHNRDDIRLLANEKYTVEDGRVKKGGTYE